MSITKFNGTNTTNNNIISNNSHIPSIEEIKDKQDEKYLQHANKLLSQIGEKPITKDEFDKIQAEQNNKLDKKIVSALDKIDKKQIINTIKQLIKKPDMIKQIKEQYNLDLKDNKIYENFVKNVTEIVNNKEQLQTIKTRTLEMLTENTTNITQNCLNEYSDGINIPKPFISDNYCFKNDREVIESSIIEVILGDKIRLKYNKCFFSDFIKCCSDNNTQNNLNNNFTLFNKCMNTTAKVLNDPKDKTLTQEEGNDDEKVACICGIFVAIIICTGIIACVRRNNMPRQQQVQRQGQSESIRNQRRQQLNQHQGQNESTMTNAETGGNLYDMNFNKSDTKYIYKLSNAHFDSEIDNVLNHVNESSPKEEARKYNIQNFIHDTVIVQHQGDGSTSTRNINNSNELSNASNRGENSKG